jgi:hypothetical protein
VFAIEPHEDGFLVRWEAGDEGEASSLGDDLFFAGLKRTLDTGFSFVVPRYRNELETLKALVDLCRTRDLKVSLDDELATRLEAGDAEQKLLARVQGDKAAAKPVSRSVTEFQSGRTLLDYQREAVGKHLRVVHSADFSVPGSGKTTVALATWAHARRKTPGLGLWVLGPLSCFQPWEDEFAACFDRKPKALRLQGTASQRAARLRQVDKYELVLTSYHTAWREADGIARALGTRPWMLVLDEAHYVKSIAGVLAATVRRLAPFAVRRLALTGTPMPRSPEDLWSIFTFLWPSEGLLGNAVQYEQRCKRPADVVCDELRVQLAPLFHRTTKAALDLPAVQQTYPVVSVESLPKTQQLMIRLIEHRTLLEDEFLSVRDQAHVRRWRRARVVRLMQAVSNPLLLADALSRTDIDISLDGDAQGEVADSVTMPLTSTDSDLARALARYRDQGEPSGKLRFVADRCRNLVAQQQKVVIWTVFLGNVTSLEGMLSDLRPLVVTGEVPTYEAEEDEAGEATREQRISAFKNDRKRCVLIANAAACAESVSLHKVCHHAIYLERSFNAAHFIQSMDRIHRQGMPKGKTAHIEIPSVPCAIERVVNRRLANRQEQLYRLLDDPMPVVGFDDETHRGYFDLDELEDIDRLFAEVVAEIKADRGRTDAGG